MCLRLDSIGAGCLVACALLAGCRQEASDPDAFLSARFFQAADDTWLKDSPDAAGLLGREEKCLIPKGTWVELKGPPRYTTATHYHAVLNRPLPDCEKTEGYLDMQDFPMNKETPPMPPDPNEAARPILRLSKTGNVDSRDLHILRLELLGPGRRVLGAVTASSGSWRAQNFRVWTKSVTGSAEPVPEGEWLIDPLYAHNGLTFAAEFGDYDTTFFETDDGNTAASLGPVYMPVYYRFRERDRSQHVNGRPRSEIGIHLDAGTPGTAGCIGIRSKAELQTLVGWFDDAATAPRRVFVDWGLGTRFEWPWDTGGAACTIHSEDGKANVRSGPGTSSGIVTVLREGDALKVVRTQGSWLSVEFSQDGKDFGERFGRAVWVHASLVTCSS